MNPKGGRPAMPDGEAKTAMIRVRVRPRSVTWLENIAKAQGRDLASVVRAALAEYVSKHAREAGRD